MICESLSTWKRCDINTNEGPRSIESHCCVAIEHISSDNAPVTFLHFQFRQLLSKLSTPFKVLLLCKTAPSVNIRTPTCPSTCKLGSRRQSGTVFLSVVTINASFKRGAEYLAVTNSRTIGAFCSLFSTRLVSLKPSSLLQLQCFRKLPAAACSLHSRCSTTETPAVHPMRLATQWLACSGNLALPRAL